MGGRTKPPYTAILCPNAGARSCACAARAQRATPARSAAYGDAKRAYFGPFGPDFVKRIEPSSVGANAQKTRLFEFSILAPVPHRPPVGVGL